jgi:protein-S-isoprenylcysteine O-methyltransferase Ste14
VTPGDTAVDTTDVAARSRGVWARAVAYMLLFGISWFVVLPAAILRMEGHADPFFRSGASVALGGALVLAGCAMSWWAGFYLITIGRGTPFPLDPTRTLVTNGPYRHIRNPQAVGTMLIVLGEIAGVRSRDLLLMIPLSIAYLEGLAAPYEDRELRTRFGARYLHYRARVPKWLPRLGAES